MLVVFYNCNILFYFAQCALIVKTSQDVDKGLVIDENFNAEVFVVETDKRLLFLTTIQKTTWSPTIKFRAIVTAEGRIYVIYFILNK
jgi:hypothetical protein